MINCVRGRKEGRGREETQEEEKEKRLEERRALQDHYNTRTPSSH
jgi:hypothetical protein